MKWILICGGIGFIWFFVIHYKFLLTRDTEHVYCEFKNDVIIKRFTICITLSNCGNTHSQFNFHATLVLSLIFIVLSSNVEREMARTYTDGSELFKHGLIFV